MNLCGIVPLVLGLTITACTAGGDGILGSDLTSGTITGGDSNTIVSGNSNVVTVPTCPLGQQDANNINGPSICCGGNYALCDGFEDAAVGAQPNSNWWAVEQMNNSYGLTANQTMAASDHDNNATIEISNVHAARGQYSLHIVAQNENTVQNGWHHDTVVNRTIFPAPNNTFWGRAFVYYNGVVPNGHCTYMDATGMIPGNNGVTYLRISTSSKLVVNYWGAAQGGPNDKSVPQNANVPMPTGVWSCMEWEYKGDTSEVFLYLNGNQVAHVQTSDGMTAPAYDTFRIGWETYSYQYNPTPPAFDMYYDEIALDYQRIGCEK